MAGTSVTHIAAPTSAGPSDLTNTNRDSALPGPDGTGLLLVGPPGL